MAKEFIPSDSNGDPQSDLFSGMSTEFLTAHLAREIDLFGISKRVEVDVIPRGAVVRIRTARDVEPGSASLNLYRDEDGIFHRLDTTEDGQTVRTPIRIVGSSVLPGTLLETGSPHIVEEGYFHYGVTHTFQVGTEEGVPKLYEFFGDPKDVNPYMLQSHLSHGTVVEDNEGTLRWSLVREQPPVGPVISAMILEAMGQEKLF
jgi:hypothetical protein